MVSARLGEARRRPLGASSAERRFGAHEARRAPLRPRADGAVLPPAARRLKPLKLLYVASDQKVPGKTGGSVHVEEVARGLAARGHEVHVLALSGRAAHERCGPALRASSRAGSSSSTGFFRWTERRRVEALLESLGIEAVLERYYNFGGEGVRAAHARGIPSILEVNSPIKDHPGSLKSASIALFCSGPSLGSENRAGLEGERSRDAPSLHRSRRRSRRRKCTAFTGERTWNGSARRPSEAASRFRSRRKSSSSPEAFVPGMARTFWFERRRGCARASPGLFPVHRRRSGVGRVARSREEVSESRTPSSLPVRSPTRRCPRSPRTPRLASLPTSRPASAR